MLQLLYGFLCNRSVAIAVTSILALGLCAFEWYPPFIFIPVQLPENIVAFSHISKKELFSK